MPPDQLASTLRRPAHAPTISSAPPRARAAELRRLLDDIPQCEDATERQLRRRSVILEYLPVARSIAARYAGRGVERSDLDQLAFVGLIKAVRRWLPGRSEDFLQFAVPTIVGEIKRYFRDHSWTVRPPRRVQELRASLNEAEQAYWQRHGGRPSDADLASEVGVEPSDVAEARGATALCRPPSLDEVHGSGWTIAQTCGADDPEMTKVEDRVAVARMLATLTERERQVVQMRFGNGWSQGRIGREIGVSQMQVSRWLRAIATKLRASWEID
jgi:RNA polymerase sigma-B factor